ncbi:MAG: dihydropteroate synthase [Candidatus Hydrogenedentales bacterium]
MHKTLFLQLNSTQQTQVMGVVNTTPDSFFDGGHYNAVEKIAPHIRALVDHGADILDIGAESSRPGARSVSEQEEIERLAPALEIAGDTGCPFSVDTCKSTVARYAIEHGAIMVNDITAFRNDPNMGELVAEKQVLCVLMHMLGTPQTMQINPHYEDVVQEVYDFLEERVAYALSKGIREDHIWIDPGFGFGKTVKQNLMLLRNLDVFARLGRPILLGTSNKSTIGAVLGLDAQERLEGTAATVAFAINKGVHCVRVHDVKAMKRVAHMCDAILGNYDETFD